MMGFGKRQEKKGLSATIAKGRALRRSGQNPEEALDFLSEAVQRFPRDPELRLLYATALLAFGPDGVATEAAKAAELGNDDPAILVRAGHLLLGNGDRDAARSCAARANELAQPGFVLESGLVHLNGLLAAFAGEDDLAEKNLRWAVTSEPANVQWARHLAVFLAERGRLQEGTEVLDEALKHVEKKDQLEKMRSRMAAEAGGS
jgi:Flp pilus assembly protein TadD